MARVAAATRSLITTTHVQAKYSRLVASCWATSDALKSVIRDDDVFCTKPDEGKLVAIAAVATAASGDIRWRASETGEEGRVARVTVAPALSRPRSEAPVAPVDVG